MLKKTHCRKVMSLQDLPDESVLNVLQNLGIRDLELFCSTSHGYRDNVCQDQGLWKFLVLRDFESSFSLNPLTLDEEDYKVYYYFLLDTALQANYLLTFPSEEGILKAIATKNHLASQYIFRKDGFQGTSYYDAIYEVGDLEMLKWLYQYDLDNKRGLIGGKVSFGEGAAEEAVAYGYLDCLIFLREHGCPLTNYVSYNAAASGQLECLQYACENGFPYDQLSCQVAALKGYIYILEYLTTVIPIGTWGPTVCEQAAQNGHIETLLWLRFHHVPWNVTTMSAAANGGHKDCLKWLRKNRCPWDKSVCESASAHGHKDCLKWLHKNGCPWDEGTLRVAVRPDHLNCFIYAYEHGCPFTIEIREWIKAQRLFTSPYGKNSKIFLYLQGQGKV